MFGLSLEQLIGGASVLVDGGHMLLDTRDFRLQQLDPLGQLVLGHRSKVLLDEQAQRVLRAAGEEVVLVHAR